MGHHVFISYDRDDQTYARKLADDLRTHGFEPWRDEHIEHGERWWGAIDNAILGCAAFVVVMTPESTKSEWVEREIMLAQREGKPIIPLLLRGKGHTLLITTQHADVTGSRMPEEAFYDRLRRTLPIVEQVTEQAEKKPPAKPDSPVPPPDPVAQQPGDRTDRSGRKRAYIVGGSIAALAAALLLVWQSGFFGDSEVDPPSSYLPLATGNQWVYQRTVAEGQKVFTLEAYRDGEDIRIVRGAFPTIVSGVSEETYLVKDEMERDGHTLWEISVSDQTARDGRYGAYTKPDTILWSDTIYSGNVAVQEILISQPLLERKRIHRGTLLIEPKDETFIFKPNWIPIELTVSSEPADIEVPAGKFENCLEIITKVKATEDGQTAPGSKGWTIYSYYAPNVGLIKEIQEDDEGTETYVLELISHELQ